MYTEVDVDEEVKSELPRYPLWLTVIVIDPEGRTMKVVKPKALVTYCDFPTATVAPGIG